MFQSNAYVRKDGRKPTDLSEILIQKDIKANCASSVYIETPYLKLLCSIKGPFYSSLKQEEASKLDFGISIKFPLYCKQTNTKQNEKQFEDILTKHILIDKYPRSKLVILIEIFEYNCDYYPYAIMAVSLALNNANVEQKGILACSNCVIDSNGVLLCDPTFDEEKDYRTKILFGCNISMKENFLFVQDGKCDEEGLKYAIASSIKTCETYQNYFISMV